MSARHSIDRVGLPFAGILLTAAAVSALGGGGYDPTRKDRAFPLCGRMTCIVSARHGRCCAHRAHWLDAYARADELATNYKFDSRPFIESLQARGGSRPTGSPKQLFTN